MKNTLLDIYRKDGTRKFFASLISIVIGLLVGAIVVTIVGLTKSDTIKGKDIWDGVRITLFGILFDGRDASGSISWGYNARAWGDMLFLATPLILTGLSVAVANKTGLFNIGAPGQYLMGTLGSLYVCLSLATAANPLPAWLIWIIAFLAGALAGAVWGAIPGMLKAFLNINEVIACIMTNWLAANIVTWVFDESNFKNVIDGKQQKIYKTEFFDVATSKMGLDKIFPGSQVNGGILVAILIAVGMYILMNKTTLGYQLKACGANRHAARYAGVKDKRNIVLSMAIAGALAAAGASLYWLAGNTEFSWETYQMLPAEGFNGIPVALLALNNPVGVVFSGVFMSMLDVVGTNLSQNTPYNEYITDVIIAVIVYLSAFALLIQMWLKGKKKKEKPSKVEDTKTETANVNENAQEGGAEV